MHLRQLSTVNKVRVGRPWNRRSIPTGFRRLWSTRNLGVKRLAREGGHSAVPMTILRIRTARNGVCLSLELKSTLGQNPRLSQESCRVFQ